MGSGLSSPLGIAGIIFIIVGIIMALIGIILLIVNSNSNKGWYIWVMLIGGIILGIIGGIMLAVALMNATPKIPYCDEVSKGIEMQQIPVQQPQVRYVNNAAMQYAPQYAPQYAQAPGVPPPERVVRYESVGQEKFDPDPRTYVTETPGTTERVTVVGPYGPGGSTIEITGVLTRKGTRAYVTADIPNHAVNVVN